MMDGRQQRVGRGASSRAPPHAHWWINPSHFIRVISHLGFANFIVKSGHRGASEYGAMLGAGNDSSSAYDAGAHKVVIDFPLKALRSTNGRTQTHTPAAQPLRFCQVHTLSKRFFTIISTDAGISASMAKRFVPAVKSLRVRGEEIDIEWIAAHSKKASQASAVG